MMNEFIHIPHDWLIPRILAEPDYLKAVIYLAKKINDNGSADFSSGDAKTLFEMSPRRYRTFMSLITSDKLTDKQATNKTTNISFEYQVVTRTKRQTHRQTSDKQNDKQKASKFIPPTEKEVSDYVSEKGYHFDPASFIPFYKSKGWKVGDQPMKDWKAACATWEQRWKRKYGNKYYYEQSAITPRTTADARAEERATMANQLHDVLVKLGNTGCQNGNQS